MITTKYPYKFITVLFCGMALHYMFITIILDDNAILKFWKELIILILFINTLLSKLTTQKRFGMHFDHNSILITMFNINLLFVAIFLTDGIFDGIFVMRRYIIPIIIYYIAKNNKYFNKDNISKMLKFVFVFFVLLSMWGIFQALILGDSFLINLGYPLKYESILRLRDSYYFGGFGNLQRVVSTFSNTNVYGALVGLIIILYINNLSLFDGIKLKTTGFFILIIAFLLTFSRSNWLAMVTILIVLFIKNEKFRKKTYNIILLLGVGILIVNIFGGFNLFEIFIDYLANTFTLEDTSAAGRFSIWKDAIEQALKNPFGVGLGKVGVVSDNLSGDISIVGESSYLAVLLDTGIQGAICFFGIIFLWIGYFAKKITVEENKNKKDYFLTCLFFIFYMLIIYLFSNHIYDLEIMMFVYFIIGLGKNNYFIDSLTVK